MIHFKKLRYKNILSTGNVFTEIELDRSPNTIVVGENGAGKSSFIDALCFVLFNKPFRDIKKNQLLNSINQKDLLVGITFHIGQIEYEVKRGIKPNIFEIHKNGTLLNQPGSSRDYQETLEDSILKLNYKSFTQIVVLGNASFTPFMQLKSYDRRIIIEDLLDIQIFSNMNTILKDRISINKKETQEINYQIDLTEDKIQVQHEYLEQLKNDVNKQIESIITERNGYETKYNTSEDACFQLSDEVVELLAEVGHEQKVKTKSKKVSDLLQKLHDKTHNNNKRKVFFEKNDNCPTCEQLIDLKIKAEKIEATQQTIKQTEDAIGQLVTEQDKLIDEIEKIDTLQGQIQNKQLRVREHQSAMKHMKDNGKSANTRIRTLESKGTQSSGDETKIRELKTDMVALDTKKESNSIDKELLGFASGMLKDGGIKTKIIRQYIPIMNKLINKYLASLEFFVNFELDEEFNETIKSRYRDAFSYASFSEGEKMRLDLALLFTWRAIAKMKNSINTNLLILDEVFDASLDSTGCDEFLKLIHELGNETNVFVISHKGDVLIDKFRSKIEFQKIKNFSRIV
jgi:DNA repair exonuclease SbcCD ATPase subunit